MKNLYTILAFLIFGLFFFINIATLKDGHNWGDDFAQYIHHAVNLVEHKPYTSDISLDYWIVYPPGFPLLLSSIIYWFGINFKILKFLNVLLWGLSALVVYGLALKRLNVMWARVLTVWFLTSPFFFTFKQEVLSDIPFMCFVLLSIWTFMKHEEYQDKGSKDLSRVFLFSAIVCMSYSLLIRWAGVSLFLAVAAYLLLVKRDWKKLSGFILGAVAACAIALQCGSLFSGYFYKTASSLQEWFLGIWYNITYHFEMIFSFFLPDQNILPKTANLLTLSLINIFLGLLLLGIMGLFIYRLYQRKVSLMGCFVFFYLMGAVLWPVRGDARYILPIIIPITIIGISCLKPVLHKVVVFIFIILIGLNIFNISSNVKFNDDDIFQKESLEMMGWVSVHIKPDERYMFSHSRALGLFTHRVGASFWVHPEDMKTWYKRIKPLHINYLIADKRFDQFSQYNDFYIKVDNDELHIKVIWENRWYKIFKVY